MIEERAILSFGTPCEPRTKETQLEQFFHRVSVILKKGNKYKEIWLYDDNCQKRY